MKLNKFCLENFLLEFFSKSATKVAQNKPVVLPSPEDVGKDIGDATGKGLRKVHDFVQEYPKAATAIGAGLAVHQYAKRKYRG